MVVYQTLYWSCVKLFIEFAKWNEKHIRKQEYDSSNFHHVTSFFSSNFCIFGQILLLKLTTYQLLNFFNSEPKFSLRNQNVSADQLLILEAKVAPTLKIRKKRWKAKKFYRDENLKCHTLAIRMYFFWSRLENFTKNFDIKYAMFHTFLFGCTLGKKVIYDSFFTRKFDPIKNSIKFFYLIAIH